MGSFCFNFANIFEFCIVLALLDRKNKIGQPGNQANERLTAKIEKWSKVCLPLTYTLFLMTYAWTLIPTEDAQAKPGRKLTPLQEVEVEF